MSLLQSSLVLHIQAGVTVCLLHGHLLEKLTRAGLYRLRLPIETGCKTTLKYVNKPVDLKKSFQIIPILPKLGLWAAANFSIGFPTETKEIWETISYAKNSTIDDVIYLIAQPYAGADMYDDFKDLGLLDERQDQSGITQTLYDTKHLKTYEIQDLKLLADERFSKQRLRRLASPRFLVTILWPKINSPAKFKYAMRVAGVFAEVAIKNILFRDIKLLNGQSGAFENKARN